MKTENENKKIARYDHFQHEEPFMKEKRCRLKEKRELKSQLIPVVNNVARK